ncbi:MAG: hypothetical protein AAGB04_18985 [Pseudomonadota bacterium]
MYFLWSLLLLLFEVAAAVAVGSIAYVAPLVFVAVTSALVLVMGFGLEWQRLLHEFPYFFSGELSWRKRAMMMASAVFETSGKALMAGFAALLAFGGTDQNRLLVLSVVMTVAIFAGTGLLRRAFWTFGARPVRWGYFRLVVPLGLLFSALIQIALLGGFLETQSVQQVARSFVFDLPAQASYEQVMELIFQVRQLLDGLLTNLIVQVLGPQWLVPASILISLNILSGFFIAIYAVIIGEFLLRMEEWVVKQ